MKSNYKINYWRMWKRRKDINRFISSLNSSDYVVVPINHNISYYLLYKGYVTIRLDTTYNEWQVEKNYSCLPKITKKDVLKEWYKSLGVWQKWIYPILIGGIGGVLTFIIIKYIS